MLPVLETAAKLNHGPSWGAKFFSTTTFFLAEMLPVKLDESGAVTSPTDVILKPCLGRADVEIMLKAEPFARVVKLTDRGSPSSDKSKQGLPPTEAGTSVAPAE